MIYCTTSQITARIPALADALAGGQSVKFQAIVDEAIAWAASTVNFYLARNYPVPFATAPEEVVQVAADLAAARVLRAAFSGGGEDRQPVLADGYEQDARSRLEQWRDGRATIAAATTLNAPLGVTLAYHSRPNASVIERMEW